MAWSPQARAAAAAARKRKGHTTAAKHIGARYTSKGSNIRGGMKYTVTAQHPGSHSQFKSKAKKFVKYSAVASGAAAVGAVGAATAYAARNNRNANAATIAMNARNAKRRGGDKVMNNAGYRHAYPKAITMTPRQKRKKAKLGAGYGVKTNGPRY